MTMCIIFYHLYIMFYHFAIYITIYNILFYHFKIRFTISIIKVTILYYIILPFCKKFYHFKFKELYIHDYVYYIFYHLYIIFYHFDIYVTIYNILFYHFKIRFTISIIRVTILYYIILPF